MGVGAMFNVVINKYCQAIFYNFSVSSYCISYLHFLGSILICKTHSVRSGLRGQSCESDRIQIKVFTNPEVLGDQSDLALICGIVFFRHRLFLTTFAPNFLLLLVNKKGKIANE